MTLPPPAPFSSSGDQSKTANVWPWYASALALLALDQVSKLLVREYLPLGVPYPIIGRSLVRFTYVQNPGIAFGISVFGIRLLLVFGWIAAVVLAIYLYRLARRRDPMRWPVMLFLAGALGNSIDRLFFGKVTDFVDVDMPDFIMERFAVFNVADSCITIGIVLLAIIVLFKQRTQDDRLPSQELPISYPGSAALHEDNSSSELNASTSQQSSSVPPDHGSGPATGSD